MASAGKEGCHTAKCQLWHHGIQSAKDATVMLLPFPT